MPPEDQNENEVEAVKLMNTGVFYDEFGSSGQLGHDSAFVAYQSQEQANGLRVDETPAAQSSRQASSGASKPAKNSPNLGFDDLMQKLIDKGEDKTELEEMSIKELREMAAEYDRADKEAASADQNPSSRNSKAWYIWELNRAKIECSDQESFQGLKDKYDLAKEDGQIK